MRKFKIDNAQLTIIIAVLTLTFSIVHFPLSIALAADSTPSADIKSKLEELKKDIASKAAKLKLDIDKKLTNKAYIGKVKAISKTSITIAGKTGPKIISINQDTVFDSQLKSSLREASKKYSLKLVSEEDSLAALGDIDETDVLIAKKIILLQPTAYSLQPKTHLWGQIVAVSEKLATLKDKGQKNIAISLPKKTSVKEGNFVILSGSLGKNDIFEASFVYIIPQGGILKPKGKSATTSAQIATPSAKPLKR